MRREATSGTEGLAMTTVGSVKCPVCGARGGMDRSYHDNPFSSDGCVAHYFCYECGYGNDFREEETADGKTEVSWEPRTRGNARREKAEFVRRVRVREKDGFGFSGEDVPFSPQEHMGECHVYPASSRGKLIWVVMTLDGTDKVVGRFATFAEALEASDGYRED